MGENLSLSLSAQKEESESNHVPWLHFLLAKNASRNLAPLVDWLAQRKALLLSILIRPSVCLSVYFSMEEKNHYMSHGIGVDLILLLTYPISRSSVKTIDQI